MNEAVIRDRLRDHWQFEGVDYDKSHDIYHDDAILEFPQSGERFVGKQNFLTWRRKYPAKLDFKIRRISHDGDLWVAENLISYDGSPYMFTVNILQFRGDKIAHERLNGVELGPSGLIHWSRARLRSGVSATMADMPHQGAGSAARPPREPDSRRRPSRKCQPIYQ